MNKPMKVKMHCLLLVISIIGVFCACASQTPLTTKSLEASGIASSDEQLGPPDRVDVVYFSRGKPCHCIAVVGETIYGTIFLYFQDELSSGKLTFQMLDLDKKENAAIANKYNAAPFSLYINVVRGDSEHIVAVPEIWSPRGGGRDNLREFVKQKIEESLDGNE
jgi:hypothetical protein